MQHVTANTRDSFDETYIAALRNRDAEITEHFFGYFKAVTARTLRRRGVPQSLVEDVQSETFARVLRAVERGAVRRPECFGAYVVAISRNVGREQMRADSWQVNSHFDDSNSPE